MHALTGHPKVGLLAATAGAPAMCREAAAEEASAGASMAVVIQMVDQVADQVVDQVVDQVEAVDPVEAVPVAPVDLAGHIDPAAWPLAR